MNIPYAHVRKGIMFLGNSYLTLTTDTSSPSRFVASVFFLSLNIHKECQKDSPQPPVKGLKAPCIMQFP